MRRGLGLVVGMLVAATALLVSGCGRSTPDPLSLVEGALAQQYFEAHHAIPSNRVEQQLGQEAHGLLRRVDQLPPPPAATHPQVDVRRVQATHGTAGVAEALLAAYIDHFGGSPAPPVRARMASWIGAPAQLPLPLVSIQRG